MKMDNRVETMWLNKIERDSIDLRRAIYRALNCPDSLYDDRLEWAVTQARNSGRFAKRYLDLKIYENLSEFAAAL